MSEERKPPMRGSGYAGAQDRADAARLGDARKAEAEREHVRRGLLEEAQKTAMQPSDWLPYKARATFNLFELACLLHGDDPERMSSALVEEQRQRNREFGYGPEFDRPAFLAQAIEAQPHAIMGEKHGGTLALLKKATGSAGMQRAIPKTKARELAGLLGYAWPPELSTATQVEEEPATAAPAKAAAASAIHKTKRRADPLAAVLSEAQRRALDETDAASVWAALVKLAESASRPAPLLGYVEAEGVKYRSDKAQAPVAYLSRDAFRKRFERAA